MCTTLRFLGFFTRYSIVQRAQSFAKRSASALWREKRGNLLGSSETSELNHGVDISPLPDDGKKSVSETSWPEPEMTEKHNKMFILWLAQVTA
jgi:hypothetical protein